MSSHRLLILLNRVKKIYQIWCWPRRFGFGRGRSCGDGSVGLLTCINLRLGTRWLSLRAFTISIARILLTAFLAFLLRQILSSVNLKVWVVEIFLQRPGQTRRSVLQLWDLQPSRIFVRSGCTKIIHHQVRLFAEDLVNVQCPFCVVFGHFKIVLCLCY